MDAAIPPPPPPPADTAPSVTSSIERKLSPGVVLLIAILAMVFFIIGLLNLLVQNLLRLRRARRRRRQVGDAAASPTAFQGQLGELFHLHDAGVDQASIDALPVFPYHAVASAAGGDGGKGPFDCAVCLCEFAGDDKLRLLPTCGHAFHVPCIDAWLLSHSTCPLCRGSILDAFADAECSPPSSPSALLALHSESIREMVAAGGGGDPADRDDEEAPPHKDAEEIVEVKLGKLRCVDGNAASARDLAATGNGSRGSLGQRRCLSMGSYEYVMDEHAALRVAVRAPKTRAASSASRRRHALSACDFGGSSKKGAWETAVTEAATAGRCGGAAASLNRDSFSTSKIWMVPAVARREEGGRRAAEPAVVRRAASFRWPAMSAGGKKQHRGGGGEASWDVEAAGGGGRGDGGAPAPAEERPSLARAAMIWVAGGRQGSHS